MKTAVVILNWNTKEYLKAFLPGVIASCEGLDAEVVVADSGSTDGSVEMMEAEFPSVRTLPLGSNYGFTGGYDRAIGTLLQDEDAPGYIVLLNSDIEVGSDWLRPLVAHMDANPGCGVCGPLLHALDKAPDGSYIRTDRFEYAGAGGGLIDRFGYPFCRGRVLSRTETDCGQYGSRKEVLWISGACLMTRSSLWKDLGGLDDRFFAHMEEIDYCWKARIRGWSVTVIPESTVWHLGGGTLPQNSPFKLKLNYRNNLLLLQNNLPGTVGTWRAALRIGTRRLLDYLSAMVYLCTGKAEYAKAVTEAHREARKLRRPQQEDMYGGVVRGYTRWCILPAAILFGKNIFKVLRRYEDYN